MDLEDGGILPRNGFEDERFREPGYQGGKTEKIFRMCWRKTDKRNDDGHAQTAGRERTEYEHGRSRKEGTRRRILLPAASGLSFVSGYPSAWEAEPLPQSPRCLLLLP